MPKILDFSHIRTHKIRGKSFIMVWRKPPNSSPDPDFEDVGQCDHPSTIGKELWCWPNQSPRDILSTIIHECFHGGHPDLDEPSVTETEGDTMKLLDRMGLVITFKPRKRKTYERTHKAVEAKPKAAKTRKNKQACIPRKTCRRLKTQTVG